VEKNDRAGQVIYDKVTWRMRIACYMTKAIDSHSEYVVLSKCFTFAA